ncbi:F-box/LRR-repeat protein At5g02910-like isoform X2 [Miscanthus floridulus]|uniref:F-box/LRR-repeat protein At5g02910-like isoform X2 n=1 Tax=Miscanthus floridulus TaxID=154761 RepID=UPI0034588AF4
MLPQKAPKNASAAAADLVEGRDHISNLPDGVLQHILSFLPAQDVVRTCLLAKRWRHMWESTTVLRFVCGGLKEPGSVEEIKEFVDHLLRLRIRGGTPLDTCDFRFHLDENKDFDMSRIVLWIRIALQCKVRVLQFIFVGDNYQDILPQDDHPFFISQYLKKLELENFNEMVPRFLDFSCCPFLEDLEIVYCALVRPKLISSQSLKCLTIKRGYFSYEWRLPIRAPNLVSLWLEVSDGRTPSLQRMPSLLTAVVKIHGYDLNTVDSDYDNNQSILLQGLSAVQNLVLISPDIEMFIFRRDLKFCSSFNKLKSLLLDEYWCEPADFSALACLKLSPVLEKLTLQLYSKGPKHKVEIKLGCKPLEMSAAISQHFKMLEIKCEVYDDRVHNVLMFLSKQLNIWFQFSGQKAMHEDGPTIT